MSKALRNTLGAIERAIGINAGGHEDRVWVTPEEAVAKRGLMFGLVEGLFPEAPWRLAAVRERLGLAFPAGGWWSKAASAEDERAIRGWRAQLMAPAPSVPWRVGPPVLDLQRADDELLPAPRRIAG